MALFFFSHLWGSSLENLPKSTVQILAFLPVSAKDQKALALASSMGQHGRLPSVIWARKMAVGLSSLETPYLGLGLFIPPAPQRTILN